MNFNNEDRIRRQKAKKLAKHYDAMVNDVKIKILNYRFKKHVVLGKTIDVIEIISKIKFHKLVQEDALIKIENNHTILEITGDWQYATSSVGDYCVAYSVKHKTEVNKI